MVDIEEGRRLLLGAGDEWLDWIVDHGAELLDEVEVLRACPCPHVQTSDEGTSYCSLAESEVIRGDQWKDAALQAEAERDRLREALEAIYPVPHYYCEDCWYSCPKAPEGCCDDAQGDDCNCGADERNAAIRSVLDHTEEGT